MEHFINANEGLINDFFLKYTSQLLNLESHYKVWIEILPVLAFLQKFEFRMSQTNVNFWAKPDACLHFEIGTKLRFRFPLSRQ